MATVDNSTADANLVYFRNTMDDAKYVNFSWSEGRLSSMGEILTSPPMSVQPTIERLFEVFIGIVDVDWKGFLKGDCAMVVVTCLAGRCDCTMLWIGRVSYQEVEVEISKGSLNKLETSRHACLQNSSSYLNASQSLRIKATKRTAITLASILCLAEGRTLLVLWRVGIVSLSLRRDLEESTTR